MKRTPVSTITNNLEHECALSCFCDIEALLAQGFNLHRSLRKGTISFLGEFVGLLRVALRRRCTKGGIDQSLQTIRRRGAAKAETISSDAYDNRRGSDLVPCP